jgi:UDP-glucuronate 4-epimerase
MKKRGGKKPQAEACATRSAPLSLCVTSICCYAFCFVFKAEGERRLSGNAKRILLTGGAGFIGSHLAEALLRRDAQLNIVDNLDEFYSPTWKKANLESIRKTGPFEFFDQDICAMERMREVFARVRPEAVVHLAARAGVRPSIEQPRLYEQVNVAGTVNLLELCREFQVSRLIFGSSSSVYGATSRAPFSEEQTDLRPISPYAATKLSGEMFCYTYSHLYKLPVVALRFFTVYGPRQRPDLAIHKFVARMEAGKPIPIFGDGKTGRDYTYVDDIVAGVLGALDCNFSSANGAPFEICNLGNSSPVKLSELVHLLECATGKKANIQREGLQQGDVPLTWADISKAGKLFGYQPRTTLEEGLRKFVAWYRSSDPRQRA